MKRQRPLQVLFDRVAERGFLWPPPELDVRSFLTNKRLVASGEVAAARWAAVLSNHGRANSHVDSLTRFGAVPVRRLVVEVVSAPSARVLLRDRQQLDAVESALAKAAHRWLAANLPTVAPTTPRALPTDEAGLVAWAVAHDVTALLDQRPTELMLGAFDTIAAAVLGGNAAARDFLVSQAARPFPVWSRQRPDVSSRYAAYAATLAGLSSQPLPASHAVPLARLEDLPNGARIRVTVGPTTLTFPVSDGPLSRHDVADDTSSPLGALRLSVAVEAALDLLAWPTELESAPLDASLAPRWSELLRALQPERAPERVTRLVFDIEPWGRIHARLQKLRKDGRAWTPGEVVDLHSLHHGNSTDDERVLADRFARLNASSRIDCNSENLRVLAGHPHVRWRGEPCRIETKPLTAVARPRDDGGVAVELQLGGRPIAPRELTSSLPGTFLHFDDQQRCVTIVDVTRGMAALVWALTRAPRGVPPEARQALLEALAASGAPVTVELDPALLGHAVAPDPRVFVRLVPQPDGLDIAFVVRPLVGAAAFPPGRGPLQLVALHDGQRVHTERDLQAEKAAARALVDDLMASEDAAAIDDDFRLALRSVDRAADLVLAVQERGVPVEWPAGNAWQVQRATARQLRIDVTGTPTALHLRGQVDVGDQTIALVRLIEASREGRRWVALDAGRLVSVSDDLRAHLAAVAEAGRIADGVAAAKKGGAAGGEGVSGGVALAIALEELEGLGVTVEGQRVWAQWRARLHKAAAVDDEVPRGVEAELRPYQREGLRFLRRLVALGAGGVLADDMGLGKTLQTIALLVERGAEGPQLVVAPTSVVVNWRRELQRFAPGLAVHDLSEGDRAALLPSLRGGDVVLASYGLVVRESALLALRTFATLILDEAQQVKNADSQRARAVRALRADVRIALSGTPLENHTGELWSIFAAVSPGLLPSADEFRARFQLPIDRDRDVDRRRALVRLVRPFLLRRTKAEVAPELPSRTEITINVTLSDAERARYDALRRVLHERARDGSLAPQQRRVQLLSALTRLRQLACHAALDEVGRDLADRPSSKLEALGSLLTDLKDNRHRALVFSQFTRLLDLVEPVLAAAGISFVRLDGSTSTAERGRAVDAFQSGAVDVFLLSLKAGGFGLNLTAADYVVHLDPWWNPAAEAQATDRAHRIGQTRPVTVYRLVAAGTIEDAVVQMQADKRALFAAVLDDAEVGAAATAWNEDDLLSLLTGADAARAADAGDEVEAAAEKPAPRRSSRARGRRGSM